jgi:predicted RNA-binding protein with RPS1 domain
MSVRGAIKDVSGVAAHCIERVSRFVSFPDQEKVLHAHQIKSDRGARLARLIKSDDYRVAFLPLMENLKITLSMKNLYDNDESKREEARVGLKVIEDLNNEINRVIADGEESSRWLSRYTEKQEKHNG